jgi:hypothetical protein
MHLLGSEFQSELLEQPATTRFLHTVCSFKEVKKLFVVLGQKECKRRTWSQLQYTL